jgi:hypothetical protein
VTDAHHDAEAVGKGLLNDMTRSAWSGVAVLLKPLENGLSQFGKVSMSAILQARFSLGSYFLQEAVGCGATDLDSCHGRGFLPRMTSLHERDHSPFGCTVLLFFHEPISFHGLEWMGWSFLNLISLTGSHATCHFCVSGGGSGFFI